MTRINSLFALESEENKDPVVQNAEQNTAELEAGMQQVAAQSDEIVEISDDIDAASRDTDILEKTSDIMSQSVQAGSGLNETDAKMAEVAVEAILNRLCIPAKRLLPATEAFGSSNSRLQATNLALENVKETIKKIWEGIKRGVKAMFEGMVKFFKMVTDTNTRLISEAKNLQKVVEKADYDQIKNPPNVMSKLWSQMLHKGSEKLDFTQFFEMHKQVTKDILLPVEIMEDIEKNLGSSIIIEEEDVFEIVSDSSVKFMSHLKHIKGSANDVKNKNGVEETGLSLGPFIGFKYINILHTRQKGRPDTISFEIHDKHVKLELHQAISLQAYAKPAILKITMDCVDLLNLTENFKKQFPEWKKVSDNVLTAADKLASSLEEDRAENSAIKKSLLKTTRLVFGNANNVGSKFLSQIPMLNIKLCQTTLKLARLSHNANMAAS